MEGGRAQSESNHPKAGRWVIILTMELRNTRTLSGRFKEIVNIFAYESVATFAICVHVYLGPKEGIRPIGNGVQRV